MPRAARELVALSQRGVDPTALRESIVGPLQRLVGAGPVFVASADPTTWLFTGATSRDVPAPAQPLFLANEFGQDDVTKFRHLATSRSPVGSLFQGTDGRPAASSRWRDVIEPLGWGDELRVALRVDGRTWGFLCLHRESGDEAFTKADVERLAPVLPHLAAGFRRTSLASRTPSSATTPLGPGVVLLDDEGNLVSATGSAAAWLHDLQPMPAAELPLAILGLAAQVRSGDDTSVLRLRSGRGGWVALHGGLLDGPGPARVAVVMEAAGVELTLPMLSATVGLTPREVDVTAAVLRGESTRTIATRLHISEYTVQTHLKSIFDKTGVRSRRELVGCVLAGR